MSTGEKVEDLTRYVFGLGAIAYLCASTVTTLHVPPYGFLSGPDEWMHRNLVEYLVAYGSWPDWNSTELIRGVNGASYSTVSSFGYWLHALGISFLGLHRIGSLVLFLILLAALWYVGRRHPLAAACGLAMTTPQMLYVFCYENSDAWVCFVGTLVGYSCANAMRGPFTPGKGYALFLTSALVPSARVHLWLPCFILFCVALHSVWTPLLKLRRVDQIAMMMIALSLASWWPITSFVHNGGDPLGMRATAWAREHFGEADLNFVPLASFPWKLFFRDLARSFYGSWGHLAVWLDGTAYYIIGYVYAVFAVIALLNTRKKSIALCFVLMGTALALLLVYCTNYDMQSQGRYLFCGYAPIIGFCVANLTSERFAFSRLSLRQMGLACVAIVMIFLNVFATADLMGRTKLFAADRHVSANHLKSSEIDFAIDEVLQTRPAVAGNLKAIGRVLTIRGWAFPNDERVPDFVTTVCLLRAGHSYALNTHSVDRPDLLNIHWNSTYRSSPGFSAESIGEPLPMGSYRIWLRLASPIRVYLHDTGRDVTVGDNEKAAQG